MGRARLHDHVVLSYKRVAKYTQQLVFQEFMQWVVRGLDMLSLSLFCPAFLFLELGCHSLLGDGLAAMSSFYLVLEASQL